jgi:hypothetical protein
MFKRCSFLLDTLSKSLVPEALAKEKKETNLSYVQPWCQILSVKWRMYHLDVRYWVSSDVCTALCQILSVKWRMYGLMSDIECQVTFVRPYVRYWVSSDVCTALMSDIECQVTLVPSCSMLTRLFVSFKNVLSETLKEIFVEEIFFFRKSCTRNLFVLFVKWDLGKDLSYIYI